MIKKNLELISVEVADIACPVLRELTLVYVQECHSG